MNRNKSNKLRNLMQIAAVLVLAGCGSTQSPDRAAVEIKGSNPGTSAPAAPAAPSTVPLSAAPNASGVTSYDGYQAAAARSGDTVASVADRIGLSATELGAYNGLSPTHPLRAGDELVLPPKPGGYASETVPTTAPQQTFDLAQANSGIVVADPVTSPIEAAPLQSGSATTGVAVAAAPATSGGAAWSPDMAAAAIDRASGFDEQGNLAPPPSAEEPLPPPPQKPVELASPELRQYQTPSPDPAAPPPPARPIETIMTPVEEPVEDNTPVEVATTAPRPVAELNLIRPVSGPIVIGFNQGAGRAQNDGIDFASPANSAVVAAASGEIALVSQSLGGLGNIVLVRHQGEFLTVYGRIEKVTVSKGEIVSQGQKIGVVSPATQPRMHFEVRQGAESLDPERFF